MAGLDQFDTWIQARGLSLRAILYADDILLLATSYEELRSKIRDVQHVLAPLGLQLSWDKCKLLRSPSVPKQVLQIEGQCIEHVVGHGLSSLMTLAALAARTVRATKSFYAHYKLLTEATVSLTTDSTCWDATSRQCGAGWPLPSARSKSEDGATRQRRVHRCRRAAKVAAQQCVHGAVYYGRDTCRTGAMQQIRPALMRAISIPRGWARGRLLPKTEMRGTRHEGKGLSTKKAFIGTSLR